MRIRSKQAVRQETITEVQSLNMMRNGIRTAVSSIAYLRNLFEEEAFEDKIVADLPLKILRPHNSEAELIVSWLDQEKQYLRLLLFSIHNVNDELLECYQFNFAYGDDESTTLDISATTAAGMKPAERQHILKRHATKSVAKDQTMQLLRNLILITQDLSPLPDQRYISMKIWYYDHRVPLDYEPPHFRPPLHDEDSMRFSDVPAEIDVGRVDTGEHVGALGRVLCLGHHALEIRIKTCIDGVSVTQDVNNKNRSAAGFAADVAIDEKNGPEQDAELPLPPSNNAATHIIQAEAETDPLLKQAIEFAKHQSVVKSNVRPSRLLSRMLCQILRDFLGTDAKVVRDIITRLVSMGILKKYARKARGFPVTLMVH